MKGLEATIIKLSKVADENEVLRIDSSYFERDDLARIDRITSIKHDRLADICYVTDGIHTSVDFEEGSGIKVISAKHPKEGYFDLTSFEEISVASHAANPRTALRENDVILSTVGTIGNAAVVRPELLPANSDRHVAILRAHKTGTKPISAEFLTTFLLCQYGKMQSRRETTGNVQPNLFLIKIRDFKITRFSDAFEKRITDLTLHAHKISRKSNQKQKEAEDTLLKALGLADWTPPNPLTYIGRAGDTLSAERIDSQYFRPLYSEVEQRLEATGNGVKLGAILTTNVRGRQPQYAEDGLPVINSKHVRTNRVVLGSNRHAIEAGSPVVVEQGDVLVNGTGVGTIGRAAPYLHNERALPDNHVTVLRAENVDPVYLSVFLNSPLGQFQIERHIKGSSGQIELYPNDIAKISFWDAPDGLQLRVRNGILSAFAEEQRAKALLKMAKRAVEIGVESGEGTALAFLDEMKEEL